MCGRHTDLGSRLGELIGVGIAYCLTLVLIVLPFVRERRQATRALRLARVAAPRDLGDIAAP